MTKKAPQVPSGTALDKPLDISEVKTETVTIIRATAQSLKKRVANARKAPEKYTVARIDELDSEIETLFREYKGLEHASVKIAMNGRQLIAQLTDLEQSISAVTDADERASLKAMKADLEANYTAVMYREVFNWLLGEVTKLRSDLAAVREKVALTESTAKRQEAEILLREKIASLKQYSDVNMLKGDVMKEIDLGASIPKATRELLFHPVWLSRKLEKEFTVLMDKSKDTHSRSDGCWIAGTARDVDACVRKLECFDFSTGKKTLLLDGKTMASVMGAGGSKAYEIEQECGVVLFAPTGSVELTLFGSEKSVAKALKKIGDVKEITAISSSTATITSDRMTCNSAVAKALQSLSNDTTASIEESCGVSITASPAVENARESIVTVRGANEGVANAIQAMKVAIKKMRLETIDGPSADAVTILRTPGVPRKGLSEVRLLMRLNELRKRAVVVKVPDSDTQIDVVTMDPEAMNDIVSELFDILDKSVWDTEKIELDREHSRCWGDNMCLLVGSKSGAEITSRRHDDGHFSLEVWGSDKAIKSAKSLISEVHAATLHKVPEEAIKPMLENKCQVLQSMQTDAVVQCHLNRFDNELWIYGLDANKRIAQKIFEEFVESVHQLLIQSTIKTIAIASDEIGRLIGPKGRVMNGIKEKSQVEEIRISEQEMKVCITGTNASIDYAISLIEEELSAKKDPTVFQIGLGEDEATTAVLSGAVGAVKTGGLLSGKTNEWIVGKPVISVEPVAVTSKDLFPSLGASASKPKSKTKWK